MDNKMKWPEIEWPSNLPGHDENSRKLLTETSLNYHTVEKPSIKTMLNYLTVENRQLKLRETIVSTLTVVYRTSTMSLNDLIVKNQRPKRR